MICSSLWCYHALHAHASLMWVVFAQKPSQRYKRLLYLLVKQSCKGVCIVTADCTPVKLITENTVQPMCTLQPGGSGLLHKQAHANVRAPACVRHRTILTRATTQEQTVRTESVRKLRRLQEVRGDGDVIDVVGGQARASNEASSVATSKPLDARLISSIQALFLPEGYPKTVSRDYLAYMLWTFPTHVLGNVAHALTTSSLLQAVGLSAGPVATTAASAAMKWITKDGIGALGRFVVGGGLAQQFDREPQRWRMAAELGTSLGAGLEIATAAFPQHFLVLASAGHFAKATSKAIGKPVFRVIQTHFAVDDNVGAVAAKEEVWEVAAQVVGYALSLAVLSAVDALIVEKGGVASGTELVAVWMVVQGTHICLRYNSLKSLVFSTLNEKRARMLIMDHIAGQPLKEQVAVNKQENILIPASIGMQPKLNIGTCSLTQLMQQAYDSGLITALASQQNGTATESDTTQNGNGADEGSKVGQAAEQLLKMYENEHHILIWKQGEATAILSEDAPPAALLRVLYQAHWLHHHSSNQSPGMTEAGLLAASVQALPAEFESFVKEAESVGWDTSHVKMGHGSIRYRVTD